MKIERQAVPIELVCIGGSQGGFEALESLLPQLPADYPCAVVVLLHQYRHGTGGLPELLGARTAMPVKAVCDKDPVLPGHLFVAPANYHARLQDSWAPLRVTVPTKTSRSAARVVAT